MSQDWRIPEHRLSQRQELRRPLTKKVADEVPLTNTDVVSLIRGWPCPRPCPQNERVQCHSPIL